jgi:hypothetical protein
MSRISGEYDSSKSPFVATPRIEAEWSTSQDLYAILRKLDVFRKPIEIVLELI